MAKLNGRLQLFQNNFHAIPIKGIGNKESFVRLVLLNCVT